MIRSHSKTSVATRVSRPAACALSWLKCVQWVPLLSALSAGAAPPAGDSLAHRVPAEVGLFVEARAADDLLLPLIEPELWTTLADAVGQPARAEDVSSWREQIARTIKFDPDVAIRLLFSRRVAFVGEGLGRTQDAVVLCQPMDGVRVGDLLRIWQAQPVEPAGGAREAPRELYRLSNNIGLVSKDGLLLFGDLRLPQGMFKKVAGFLRERNGLALADDPAYRKLLARVPADPDGVLFARLARRAGSENPPAAGSQPAGVDRASAGQPGGGGATSQPSESDLALPELPGPLRGASTVLFSLHRQGSLLHFTAVGDAEATARHPSAGGGRPWWMRLPRQTLLVWDGEADYAGMLAGIRRLPDNNVLRLVMQSQQQGAVLDDFIASLRPRACVAVGLVAGHGQNPPVPALAVIIPSRDAAFSFEGFTKLAGGLAAQYSLLALASGKPPLEPSEIRRGDLAMRTIDLTPLLSPDTDALLAGPELCWAVADDALIIATHSDWLARVATAEEAVGAMLAGLAEMSAERPTPDSDTYFAAHSGAIADVGTLWLNTLSRRMPEIMNESWWRANQPSAGRVWLGIRGEQEAERKRLAVTSVAAGSVSDGVLQVGDKITGCNGKRFATTQPVAELRDGIEQRPHARFVELLVEREGVLIALRLPVPFVDPIQALRRAVAIGGLVGRMVYFDDLPQRGGARGLLTLELRGKGAGKSTLGDFLPQPTSRPAEALATQPTP